jgi:Luciferase-like monooxygenase
VATVAEGLWIGTNLILLPLHNPVELAEIAAFMDVVTSGRFMFGVGLGYRPEEFAVFGIPMLERVSRLVEGIDIVRRLWSEDRVTHLGRHWQFHDVSIRPRPLQSPSPPILIGAQVKAAIVRAARIADGWLAVPVPRLDEIAEQASLFATTRAAAGLPQSRHICRLIEVSCAGNEDQAFGRAAPYLLEKYASYASWGLQDIALDRNANPEQQLRQLAAERFAIGTPAQVADASCPASRGDHSCKHAGELARNASSRYSRRDRDARPRRTTRRATQNRPEPRHCQLNESALHNRPGALSSSSIEIATQRTRGVIGRPRVCPGGLRCCRCALSKRHSRRG